MKIIRNKKQHNTGAILLSSLWILIILTLMAAGIAFRSRLMIRLTENYLNTTRHYNLALSGYYQSVLILEESTPNDYSSLADEWAMNPALFKNISMENTGSYTIMYQDFSSQEPIYGICDEERKININTIPREILLRLPGFDEKLADGLTDWIDEDSKELPEGAENDYYQDNDLPYNCKNAPLAYLAELKMIRGFSDEIIQDLQDLVTVYGDGAVNINTASREVFKILGIDDPLIDVIIEYRNGEDSLPGTEDDQVFTNDKEIVKTLSEYEPIYPDEAALLQNLVSQGLLGILSKNFTITSYGYTGTIDESTQIEATIDLSGETPTIKKWEVRR